MDSVAKTRSGEVQERFVNRVHALKRGLYAAPLQTGLGLGARLPA